VYPCKGGGPNDYVYIFTSRANPEHWTRLLKVLGREDLIGDARYATPDARTERRAEVDAIVTEWTRKHDKHEAMRLVSLATIPAAAVHDTAELAADRTFEERGIRQTMKHPTVGDYVMSGWPVRFGGGTPAVEPAPLLGEHGAEVLGEWLKMEKAEIDALRKDSIVS
jgi:formyl-CoA transferase